MIELLKKDFIALRRDYMLLIIANILIGILVQAIIPDFMSKGFLAAIMPTMFGYQIIAAIDKDSNSKSGANPNSNPTSKWQLFASKYLFFGLTIYITCAIGIIICALTIFLMSVDSFTFANSIYLITFGICFASIIGSLSLPICFLINKGKTTNAIIGFITWIPAFYISGWILSFIDTSLPIGILIGVIIMVLMALLLGLSYIITIAFHRTYCKLIT